MFPKLIYFKYGKYLRMNMLEKDKIQYITEKRKKLILSLVFVAVFGSILYISGVIHEQEKNVEKAVSGGLFDIAKKIENEVAEQDAVETFSKNLLKSPVSLLYSIKDDTIRLKETFKINQKVITDGVFTFSTHGDTLYSTGFTSQSGKYDCRGVAKKKNDRFFIYFCTEK